MQFTILCAVYSRLAEAALPIGSKAVDGMDRPGLSSVLLQYRNGSALAVACNSGILVCEYLGKTDQADAKVALTINPILRTLALSAPEATMTITHDAAWTFAAIEGVGMFPQNAAVPICNEWEVWPGLVPESLPAKPIGALIFDAQKLALMGKVSPSGWVSLPKCYDASNPIICRDAIDLDWFGLFLPIGEAKIKSTPKAATIPEWWK